MSSQTGAESILSGVKDLFILTGRLSRAHAYAVVEALYGGTSASNDSYLTRGLAGMPGLYQDTREASWTNAYWFRMRLFCVAFCLLIQFDWKCAEERSGVSLHSG